MFIAGLPSVSVPENALLVDENGRIDFTAAPDGELPGLYIDGYKLGYHNGTSWKTYMANNGDFYLAGTSAEAKRRYQQRKFIGKSSYITI